MAHLSNANTPQKRSLSQLFKQTRKIEISNQLINNIHNLNTFKTMWINRDASLFTNSINHDNFTPLLNLVKIKASQLSTTNSVNDIVEYLSTTFKILESDKDFNLVFKNSLSILKLCEDIDYNLLIRELLINIVLYVIIFYINCSDYYNIDNIYSCRIVSINLNNCYLTKSYIIEQVNILLNTFAKMVPVIVQLQHAYDKLENYHFRFLEEKQQFVADKKKNTNLNSNNLEIAIAHYDKRIIEIIDKKKKIYCLVFHKIQNLLLPINFYNM